MPEKEEEAKKLATRTRRRLQHSLRRRRRRPGPQVGRTKAQVRALVSRLGQQQQQQQLMGAHASRLHRRGSPPPAGPTFGHTWVGRIVSAHDAAAASQLVAHMLNHQVGAEQQLAAVESGRGRANLGPLLSVRCSAAKLLPQAAPVVRLFAAAALTGVVVVVFVCPADLNKWR